MWHVKIVNLDLARFRIFQPFKKMIYRPFDTTEKLSEEKIGW